MNRHLRASVIAFAPILAAVYACSSDDAATVPTATTTPDASVTPVAVLDASTTDDDAGARTLELQFEARVGDALFACGQTYEGLGTTSATVTPGDLRFFIHDVRLLAAEAEVPVTLAPGPMQSDRVALLDFENKTGNCSFGTSETNDRVQATVPAGAYDGIAFTIGIPEDLNHIDAQTAGAPYANSHLQWDWTNGFIHFAMEVDSLKTTPLGDGGVLAVPPFYSHIGSTACDGTPTDGGTAACARSNRPIVRLGGFDPETSKIVVDVKKLYEGSNLDENTPSTISGCMSSPSDPECGPVFTRMGLSLATGATVGTSTIFSVAPR